jgi:hypothetical protein
MTIYQSKTGLADQLTMGWDDNWLQYPLFYCFTFFP